MQLIMIIDLVINTLIVFLAHMGIRISLDINVGYPRVKEYAFCLNETMFLISLKLHTKEN